MTPFFLHPTYHRHIPAHFQHLPPDAAMAQVSAPTQSQTLPPPAEAENCRFSYDYENCAGRHRHGRDWGTLDDKGNWTPIEATPVLPILGRVAWAIGWGAVLIVGCVLLVAA